MQFNVVALALATMATVASAGSITTVYACASTVSTVPGVAAPTGAASPTVASTGVASAPTPTGSPIAYAGAASLNGVSAFGIIVAGGVALVRSPEGFQSDLKLTHLPVPVNISSSPLRFDGVTFQHLRSGIFNMTVTTFRFFMAARYPVICTGKYGVDFR
ncbi:hypothetical protein LSUB1_G004819 [Lachnellula subtilissima]|uniref:Uncharacterized protein n=1 Tax=Lachnellula subtilissima TaxID=602034 RepID=A0A8H8RI22_9HELO|nr:hypothetical protein LSUB1_G004819 [Lachnellula subtilissima]